MNNDQTQPQFDVAQIREAYHLLVKNNVPDKTLHLSPEVYLPLLDEIERTRKVLNKYKKLERGMCSDGPHLCDGHFG